MHQSWMQTAETQFLTCCFLQSKRFVCLMPPPELHLGKQRHIQITHSYLLSAAVDCQYLLVPLRYNIFGIIYNKHEVGQRSHTQRNLKRALLPHLLSCISFCLLSPGLRNHTFSAIAPFIWERYRICFSWMLYVFDLCPRKEDGNKPKFCAFGGVL